MNSFTLSDVNKNISKKVNFRSYSKCSVISTDLAGEINAKKKDCYVGYHFSDTV